MSDGVIGIQEARENNLKGVSLTIPRDRLVVVTGVSGSGKSSLTFDTLYAEGNRRYVESMSFYARQFLGRRSKPAVGSITGMPPAIAIEQHVANRNSRSTVGTQTEIYEYLKHLFAAIGKTYSPVSGKEVTADGTSEVVSFIRGLPVGTTVTVSSLLPTLTRHDAVQELMAVGFNKVLNADDWTPLLLREVCGDLEGRWLLPLDQLTVRDAAGSNDADYQTRLAELSAQAMKRGNGACRLLWTDADGNKCSEEITAKFSRDGLDFLQPTADLFSFNNPYGACPTCEGFGTVVGISPELVVPNEDLSVAEGCVACWAGPTIGQWKTQFLSQAARYKFPAYTPYKQLTDAQRDLLWHGAADVEGIDAFFNFVQQNQYKVQYRALQSRYRGRTVCPVCHGRRLRPEAENVKINGATISDLNMMALCDLRQWFEALELDAHDAEVANRALTEIRGRLEAINDIGLGYLTLSRSSSTLSGGESQRIGIVAQIGGGLRGALYVLDEPSIGLHAADTRRMVRMLRALLDKGSSVVVVEHEEEIIRSADWVVDMGPEAGRLGGEVVFNGPYDTLLKDSQGLTARYLRGELRIDVPASRRAWNKSITITNACQNNLRGLNTKIPLNIVCCVTGVSGSGKSTLVMDVLHSELLSYTSLMPGMRRSGHTAHLSGDLDEVARVELVDQNPIGKSTRSNAATYIKAYDEVRKLMALQPLAQQNGFGANMFSFNTPGGRCEVCQGEGRIKIEMQFMADVVMECEECRGRRFKDDILEVRYRGKNIDDILRMTIDEACEFFGSASEGGPMQTTARHIAQRLAPLREVGLGYVQMGQSSTTLSGGENQRVKLASYLADAGLQPTLFIFDEPTTGLHFHDIAKLLCAFARLVEAGHSVLVVEHNLDVVKSADWVVDLGPGGGASGGTVVAEGTPETVAANEQSLTGQYLRERLPVNGQSVTVRH